VDVPIFRKKTPRIERQAYRKNGKTGEEEEEVFMRCREY